MNSIEKIAQVDSQVALAIKSELDRQRDNIELIASENFVSQAVLCTAGSVLTNKYAEGYPDKRYYNGCHNVDIVESIAIQRAKQLFDAEHANVQSHSGASANYAVWYALLNIGDTVLGMDLNHGGHLTHGSKVNYSGKLYNVVPYGVNKETETIDYDEVQRLADTHKPKMIVCGASAYPRAIDFERFAKIAKSVGAYLMVDMAHIAGLVAASLHQNPVPYADVVTTTTHKTLRGPRGGMILCKQSLAQKIDKAVFPGTQGGPLMHIIAAKAVAFKEALQPSFKLYQTQIVKNAKALADALIKNGMSLVSNGTDNHLMLVKLFDQGIGGADAATLLDKARITVNKNSIPFDTTAPSVTSGIRLGTPAVTTRGFIETDMVELADMVVDVIKNKDQAVGRTIKRVEKLCKKYPLYSDIL